MNEFGLGLAIMFSSKVVVFVETPFQLLCACEYISQNKVDPYLVVRKSSVGLNDMQLDSMLSELGMAADLELKVAAGSTLDYALAFLRLFPLLIARREKVVIGSYFSGIQKLFSRAARKEEVVLLDDGVATVLADRIISKKFPGKYSVYSIFPLPVEHYVNVGLNRFSSISARYGCIKKSEWASIFIGQKLVDINAIALDAYVRVVEHAVAACEGGVLNYIPHRAESDYCVRRISEIPGVKIVTPDCAIEYYLLKNNVYPERVYSVISTALYSIASIYPEAAVICVRPKSLRSEIFSHYGMIMDAFAAHPSGIEFVDVE